MKTPLLQIRLGDVLFLILFISVFCFCPGLAWAKSGDDQDQIILLNDSAAALEDSNPRLSKSLTQLADERQKEWELKNTNKDVAPTPVTGKEIAEFKVQIELLNKAALAVNQTYPLIARGLRKMAKDINRKIEIEK